MPLFDRERWRYALRKRKHAYNLFASHFERVLLRTSVAFDIASVAASIACLIALAVYAGYNLSPSDKKLVWLVLRVSQGIFGASIFYGLFFRFRYTMRQSRIFKWVVDVFLLISLVAWAYPHPAHPWVQWLSTMVYSTKFLFSVLGAYSIVTICYSLSRIPNRRTNPSLLMGGSFLVFIILGSFMLMLPRCTLHGISYVDSLFVSASAVCITGLSPVDIHTTFTPFGVLVLTVLVQLGSLGVITFTSFFALFFTGSTSIYNQLLLRDIIYSKSMNSLVPTLLYVLGFTVTIELVGALAVFFAWPEGFDITLNEKVLLSLFHSMSSFCNAGFSCLPDGMSNALLLHSNQNIYLVTSVLIIAGAIGFPILVNFKEIAGFYIKRFWLRLHGRQATMRLHIFDLNTKIVLCTTTAVLIFGSVAFFLLERNNTLAGMTTYEKIVQSVFNSLIPRSAGFASVNPSMFLDATLIVVMIQMVIGGSSQSMAGGIKVNTLGAILLNLKSILLSHASASAFNRTINVASVRRANAVMTISTIALSAYVITMLVLEPGFSAKAVIFETISALFTVGSSLGITAELRDVSKIVLCTAMFLGRVGILSILTGIMVKRRDVSAHLPQDNIIIN